MKMASVCAVLGSLALLASACGGVRPPVPVATPTVDEFDAYLQAVTKQGDPPALSLVMVEDGEVVLERNIVTIDLEGHVPASSSTRYRWYMILAAIIESVTGMPYESYIAAKLLDPLGMSSTSFLCSDVPIKRTPRARIRRTSCRSLLVF